MDERKLTFPNQPALGCGYVFIFVLADLSNQPHREGLEGHGSEQPHPLEFQTGFVVFANTQNAPSSFVPHLPPNRRQPPPHLQHLTPDLNDHPHRHRPQIGHGQRPRHAPKPWWCTCRRRARSPRHACCPCGWTTFPSRLARRRRLLSATSSRSLCGGIRASGARRCPKVWGQWGRACVW
jgi:hypothetical protein